MKLYNRFQKVFKDNFNYNTIWRGGHLAFQLIFSTNLEKFYISGAIAQETPPYARVLSNGLVFIIRGTAKIF